MLAGLWTLMQPHGGATKHWRESGCARCACKWEIKREGLVPCGSTDTAHLLGEPNVCQGMESQHIIDCALKLRVNLPLTPRRNSFIYRSLPCLFKLTKHTKHQTNWFLGLKQSDFESKQEFIDCGGGEGVSISTTLKQNKNIFFFPEINPSLWW